MMMPVASRSVRVWPATWARATAGSSSGVWAGIGDSGVLGSGSTTCSAVQTES
jgi:hypothetical protein